MQMWKSKEKGRPLGEACKTDKHSGRFRRHHISANDVVKSGQSGEQGKLLDRCVRVVTREIVAATDIHSVVRGIQSASVAWNCDIEPSATVMKVRPEV